MFLQDTVHVEDIRSGRYRVWVDFFMNWYLKKSDGEVYGPVDLATLQLWATDSRIAPEDQVSTDQKSWQLAPALSELGMEWIVQLRDETPFGPLHLLSVKDLVQDGSVSRRGKIKNVTTGEEQVVGEALVSALIAQTNRMQGMIDTLTEQLAVTSNGDVSVVEIRKETTETLSELEQLQSEVRRLTEQRDHFQEEADKWQKQYEDIAGTAAARENELKARFSTAKSTEARMDGLKQEIKNSQRLYQEERTAAHKREEDLKNQIRKLKTEAQRVQEFAQQAEKWKSLYEHQKAGAGRAVTRKSLDDTAGDSDLVPRVRLEEVERKLAQVQKSYQQLLRAVNRNLSPGGQRKPPPADNLRRWQVS